MPHRTFLHNNRLTTEARHLFIQAANELPPRQRTLCIALALLGSRMTDLLRATTSSIDFQQNTLTIRRDTRKRRAEVRLYVPPQLLMLLDHVHGIRHWQQKHLAEGQALRGRRLWPVTRMTAWRWVTTTMQVAGFDMAVMKPSMLLLDARTNHTDPGPDVARLWAGQPATPLF